jgi:hypothetical protein
LPLHEFDKLPARHQWECGVAHRPSFEVRELRRSTAKRLDDRCASRMSGNSGGIFRSRLPSK